LTKVRRGRRGVSGRRRARHASGSRRWPGCAKSA